MNKVYLAVPRAPDKMLGNVNEDGKVYRRQVGIDDRIGEVDLSSGKIYSDRFGPDKKIGHVNLENGKVYTSRLGPDEYVGQVDGHGHMHRHESMATDDYIGKIDPFMSYSHSAGAMLLLVLPALEETSADEAVDQQDESSNGDDPS